jgi:hypothetical protein
LFSLLVRDDALISWNTLSEQICEMINDETGITVKPDEVSFKLEDELWVYLFGESFASVDSDYMEDADEEDLAYTIVDSVDDPVKRVTENRIGYLQRIIEPMLDKFGNPSFVIEDRGYTARARHYLNESEYEWDYPDLVLVIDVKGKRIEAEVDPYQIDAPFDKEELIKQIKPKK